MSEACKIFQQIKRKTGEAIIDFGLIENGDRILVAVSGGKDSYILLHVLEELRRRAPVRFELIAANVDPGFPHYRSDRIKEYLAQQGFNCHLETTGNERIIEEKRRPGTSYCAFCARLRRGCLYTLADRLQCNKLALGHHLDDAVETLLLNQFFSGRLAAMSAKMLADNGRHTVIRPLIYVAEQDIRNLSEKWQLPLVDCSCPVAGTDRNRQRMKQLLNQLEQEIPAIRRSLLSALKQVEPRHLLDPRLSKAP